MRMVALISFLFLVTLGPMTVQADTTRHKYDSGVVSYVDNNQVVIQNGPYVLTPGFKVILITRESNGAHYRRKGSLADVSVGKRVYLKTVGRTVSEIVVER